MCAIVDDRESVDEERGRRRRGSQHPAPRRRRAGSALDADAAA